MNKTKKILTAGITALLMTSVFASPLSDSTFGLFKSDADKYMDVLKFSEVNFDNLFGNINISDATGLSAGAAFTVADLYFGTEYYGKMFRLSNTKNTEVTTTQKEGTGPDAGQTGSVEEEINETLTNSLSDQFNQFSILTGIGNLGIKASFMTSGGKTGNQVKPSLLETNDINPPTVISERKNYSSNVNYDTAVETGFPVNIGETELALKTGLGLNVIQDTTKKTLQYYNWYNNQKGNLIKEFVDLSKAGKIEIKPLLYAGISDWGFHYNGNFGVYANGLKSPEKTKLNAKTYSSLTDKKITVDEDGTVYTENTISAKYKTVKSDIYNRIGFDYTKSLDLNEKITVGLKASADLVLETMRDGTDNEYLFEVQSADYTNTVGNNGTVRPVKETRESVSKNDQLTTTNIIGINPELSVAAKYRMIPSKVTVNVGFHVVPDSSSYTGPNAAKYKNSLFIMNSEKQTGYPVNVTTETIKYEYEDGTVITGEAVTNVTERTTSEKLYNSSSFYKLNTSLYCGITFHMTENLDFDCIINANEISKTGISDLKGLFQMNMAATFRF